MRSHLPSLLALVCAAVFTAASPACINDREVIQAEHEFKSRYLDQPAAPQYQPEPSSNPNLMVYGGAGAVMAITAFALGFIRPRRS